MGENYCLVIVQPAKVDLRKLSCGALSINGMSTKDTTRGILSVRIRFSVSD
jgi:hypothetical protein